MCVEIELTNATATFAISTLHIEQHLPQLFARMQIAPGLNYTTAMDLGWTVHRYVARPFCGLVALSVFFFKIFPFATPCSPLNELRSASETYGTIWMPTTPEDETI